MIKQPLIIATALVVSGCGTKFGLRLGDMGYYHKPHCEAPFKEWQDETLDDSFVRMSRVSSIQRNVRIPVRTPGHWHYFC